MNANNDSLKRKETMVLDGKLVDLLVCWGNKRMRIITVFAFSDIVLFASRVVCLIVCCYICY